MQEEDKVFSHALYHVVAHWAAFMLTLGMLVTIGLAAATVVVPAGMKRWFCASAIAIVLFACLYFLFRIQVFAKCLDLPDEYLRRILVRGIHWRWNLVAGGVFAVVVAAGDWFILFNA